MTPRSFLITPELGDYVRAGSEPLEDAALAADERFETVLLPVSDGLTLLRKR